MERIKKILQLSLTTAVFVILPFVAFTIVTSKTSAIAGIRSFVVLSGSMEPSLPVGSIIFIQKSPAYQEGNVIAFQNGAGQTVTHRVVDVIKKNTLMRYKTKGDANKNIDEELVTASKVIGTQLFFVPYVGRLLGFLRTPLGFFYGVLFPGIVFIVLELWGIKREIEVNVEKKVLNRIQANPEGV